MKNLILFVLTLLSLGSSAQIKRTIHVATAGTLSNFISENEKYQIEELTLTGKLNGTDFLYIRDMAGVNAYINDDGDLYPGHKTTNGKLNTLNLSQADIVSGGSFYEHSGETGERYERLNFGIYYTNDNCVSKYLFSDTRIKSIILPNSVTSIEPEAFFNCSNLSSIIIESGNSYYDSRNDCNAIIEKSTNTLIVGCKNTIIPNGVTSIGKNAFYNCSGLTSINIPNSVKSIDSRAFAVCSDLTSITIPDGVTETGDRVLQSCRALTSITIGNGMTYIPDCWAEFCDNLQEVTIGKKVTSIGWRAFPAFNLKDVTCYAKNAPSWNGLSLAIFLPVLVQRTARLRASTRFVYSMIYEPQSLILMISTTSSRF